MAIYTKFCTYENIPLYGITSANREVSNQQAKLGRSAGRTGGTAQQNALKLVGMPVTMHSSSSFVHLHS